MCGARQLRLKPCIVYDTETQSANRVKGSLSFKMGEEEVLHPDLCLAGWHTILLLYSTLLMFFLENISLDIEHQYAFTTLTLKIH